MQPQQHNPYGFIMDGTPKKRGFSFGGGSQKDRLLQVAIIAIIFIVIVVIAMSFLGNIGKENTVNLYKVAAAQQDLIDLTALGSTNVRDAAVVTSSTTAGAVISSQNANVIAVIAKTGNKKPTKAIAVYRDTTYTKLLDDAKANGKYDETYTALFANRIDDYRTKLQTAYAGVKNAQTKKQLSDAYQQLILLSPSTTVN